ncbi:hypothetical protein CPB84DRAFT_1742776 [Gymnopilus junonius]|uniref:Uncharacterized protein n=1 Tax=Gymnopilus junonius TaxID=109634 RepID=A0A9P5TUV6_GYMJU|nr:hypothetical protein CPB84DRAFT_1742776 [Gymnopilus junonius]
MYRSVLVDDTDSGIQYIGSWFADTGTLDNIGNFGPPYKSTLHGINQMEVSPTISKVVITGTVQFPAPSGATSSNPSWATSANQQTFWFDYIQYIPSVTVNLANSDLSTSLTWVGFYDNSLSLSATTATYSVDDQNPVPFNLNGVAAQGSGIQDNQILFQTPQLSAGKHTIQVVYQGNNQTAPLSLYILEIQGEGGSGSPNATSTSSGGATSVSSGPQGYHLLSNRHPANQSLLKPKLCFQPQKQQHGSHHRRSPRRAGPSRPLPLLTCTKETFKSPKFIHPADPYPPPHLNPNTNPNSKRMTQTAISTRDNIQAFFRLYPNSVTRDQDSGLRFPEQTLEVLPPDYTLV